jgi:hypothetical protein
MIEKHQGGLAVGCSGTLRVSGTMISFPKEPSDGCLTAPSASQSSTRRRTAFRKAKDSCSVSLTSIEVCVATRSRLSMALAITCFSSSRDRYWTPCFKMESMLNLFSSRNSIAGQICSGFYVCN